MFKLSKYIEINNGLSPLTELSSILSIAMVTIPFIAVVENKLKFHYLMMILGFYFLGIIISYILTAFVEVDRQHRGELLFTSVICWPIFSVLFFVAQILHYLIRFFKFVEEKHSNIPAAVTNFHVELSGKFKKRQPNSKSTQPISNGTYRTNLSKCDTCGHISE